MSTKRIWSANGTAEYLKSLPEESKKATLVDYGYDSEMLASLDNEGLNKLIDEDEHMWEFDAEELENEIIPKINAQTRDGVVFFYGDVDSSYAEYADSLYDGTMGFFIKLEDEDGIVVATKEDGTKFKLYAFPESDEELASIFEQTLAGYIDNACEDELELRPEVIENMAVHGNLVNLYQDKDLGDFAKLPELLTPIKLDDRAVESLNEAKAKNPEGLEEELNEIKPLVDEYGFEFFTAQPLVAFDNDPIAIESTYPNFFKIIKAFFKEMDILEDPNDMDELEDNWATFTQVDWDTCMEVAERCLKSGKSQQVEKVYAAVANAEENKEVDESVINESSIYTKLDELVDQVQNYDLVIDELEQWLPTDRLNELAQDIAKDLDIEISDPSELRDLISPAELFSQYNVKLSTDECEAFATDLAKDLDLEEDCTKVKESFNMPADEFKKRVVANWGATDESLNEDVNDLTDEEFNKIHDAIEKHADYFSDIYGEAFEGLDEVTLEAAQEQADILCKEAVEDIIYEEMPGVYDRITDIPAESMCRDLDLYDYWIYIDEDEIDEIVAAEEEREKENQPWNVADDRIHENDESLNENKKLLEEANNYLNDQWQSQSEKVRDSYKKLLKLENIPMDEDLVDWAVDDCCIKHNQSRNNVREMLRGENHD